MTNRLADRLDLDLSAGGFPIEPVEGVNLSALGEIGEWIATALKGPPSTGSIGRMELLWQWDRLPADKRREVLLIMRGMAEGECGPSP